MKLSSCAVLFAAVTARGFAAHAALRETAPAGGRDVTVALFTSRDVRSISVVPLTPEAWVAPCASCLHKPLSDRFVISGGEVYMGGTLRLEDASNPSITLMASGLWHVRGYPHGMDAVLTLPSERYTAAAVSGEAAVNEPAESLRALSVVARTYALNGPHYSAAAGHLPADLCDSTQCQALRLGSVSRNVLEAVSATAGETLWYANQRAQVFFSQHCGGHTADGSETWTNSNAGGAQAPRPYLRSHADPFCLRKEPATWHASILLEQLEGIAKQEGWRLPAQVARVRVARRDRSGRATRLSFQDFVGKTAVVSASSLRFAVGRSLGWNRLRSDLYEVGLRGNSLEFRGRGHGHGVGLCQAGATEMANERRDARAILSFYFPGTHLGVSPGDDGWQTGRSEDVLVASTQPLATQTKQTIAVAWKEARTRFPVDRSLAPPTPTVVFAPSTELFRQLTAQPGWDLASTRGSVVTLQPESLVRRPRTDGQDFRSTLRHEFLHVLIEQEATDRAPLWLREGLAEALGTDLARTTPPSNSGGELDSMLLHAASAGAARRAHEATGSRVSGLVLRYGLSTVRSWLRSGVPATIASGV